MVLTATGQTPDPHISGVQAPNAQALLERVVSKHNDVKLIGLHMTPPQIKQNVMIACTDVARVGNVSSPGDLATMTSQKIEVEFKQKGNFYEVKAPLYDSHGKLIGMMVELLQPGAVSTEGAAQAAVEGLRKELQSGIPNEAWMFEGKGK